MSHILKYAFWHELWEKKSSVTRIINLRATRDDGSKLITGGAPESMQNKKTRALARFCVSGDKFEEIQ